jgi:hypothetical protein
VLLDGLFILERALDPLRVIAHRAFRLLGDGGLGPRRGAGVACCQLTPENAHAPKDLALRLIRPDVLLDIDVVRVLEVADVEVDGVPLEMLMGPS